MGHRERNKMGHRFGTDCSMPWKQVSKLVLLVGDSVVAWAQASLLVTLSGNPKRSITDVCPVIGRRHSLCFVSTLWKVALWGCCPFLGFGWIDISSHRSHVYSRRVTISVVANHGMWIYCTDVAVGDQLDQQSEHIGSIHCGTCNVDPLGAWRSWDVPLCFNIVTKVANFPK